MNKPDNLENKNNLIELSIIDKIKKPLKRNNNNFIINALGFVLSYNHFYNFDLTKPELDYLIKNNDLNQKYQQTPLIILTFVYYSSFIVQGLPLNLDYFIKKTDFKKISNKFFKKTIRLVDGYNFTSHQFNQEKFQYEIKHVFDEMLLTKYNFSFSSWKKVWKLIDYKDRPKFYADLIAYLPANFKHWDLFFSEIKEDLPSLFLTAVNYQKQYPAKLLLKKIISCVPTKNLTFKELLSFLNIETKKSQINSNVYSPIKEVKKIYDLVEIEILELAIDSQVNQPTYAKLIKI